MSSPFASLSVSDPIRLPFDDGQWIRVRKLTGRELDAAAQAHRDHLAGGSPRLWPATFRRALERGASDPEVLKAIADPLTGYDRFALVRSGLDSWSYPQPIKPVTTTVTGTTAVSVVDAIDDLDDDAVDFIATEVLRRTKPGLFYATEEDARAAQKEMPAAASVA